MANPTKGETIEVPCTGEIDVYDPLGNRLETIPCGDGGYTSWFPNVAAGNYLLKEKSNSQRVVVIK